MLPVTVNRGDGHRVEEAAIGLFAGTFTHAMLSMRAVRTTLDGGTVPGLAVIVAIGLVLGCIGTLVWYLNHITQSLRTAALVGWVANDTITTLDRVSGSRCRAGPRARPHHRATGRSHLRDQPRPSGRSRRTGELPPGPAVGGRRFRADRSCARPHRRRTDGALRTDVVRSIVVGPERTLNQDVAYGIRLLVDIAERSLSSGPFEDPTTAVQAIDRIHDILRQIARRPLHSGQYHDAAGTLRLLAPTMQWQGFVQVAFDEIRQAGAGSPQVSRRLKAALDDLLTVAPPERRPALEHQLALLGRTGFRRSPK
ncbi:MAG: DUF2254 family protein [Nocardioidaceae bacterium]